MEQEDSVQAPKGIWATLRQDWPPGDGPSKASLANAERLLEGLAPLNLLPDRVTRGYWPTTQLHWSSPTIEIEVFDADLELYIFPPLVPQFEVKEFDATREADLVRLIETVQTLVQQNRS